jgi:hypothetical protein
VPRGQRGGNPTAIKLIYPHKGSVIDLSTGWNLMLGFAPGERVPGTHYKRHTECSVLGAPCEGLELARNQELGEPIVLEPTDIKRAPHKAVPKGRGPRLRRQVKADLRYGTARVVYLYTCDFPT